MKKNVLVAILIYFLATVAIAQENEIEPAALLKSWIEAEVGNESQSRGQHVVNGHLATVTPQYESSIRMVNIFWEEPGHAAFFTHRNTFKVACLSKNPFASVNVWLPNTKKQITIDGKAVAMRADKLQEKWQEMPRNMQLRFIASDHKSKVDEQDQILNERLQELEKAYPVSDPIPLPEAFVGYYIEPKSITFYEVKHSDFASKLVAEKKGTHWEIAHYQP